MKRLLIFVSIIFMLACSTTPNEHGSPNNTYKTDSIRVEYKNLLTALKHDYVLYYRSNQAMGGDLTMWGMPANDSVYKIDSSKYAERYKKFFSQDTDFIKWLLSFKNDTIQSGLWHMYHNPVSSHISECNFLQLNNSRAAIILLENFLNGDGFTCFECKYVDGPACSSEKYKTIESFLLLHQDKTIPELRHAWQTKNTN